MSGSIVYVTDEGGPALDVPGDVTITLPHISTSPRSVLACAAIHELDPPAPLVIITHGALLDLLPSIALAQRTAHRAIAGYVLVDPQIEAPMPDWPDAPVLVISADEGIQRAARLRNWRVGQNTDVTDAVRAFVAKVMPNG
jgi:hypothetical protein